MQTRHSKKFVVSGFAFVLITLFAAGVGGLSQLNQLNKQQLALTENYLLKHDLIHRMLTASRERAITLNQIANLADPFERDKQIMRYHSLGADFAAARERLLELPLVRSEQELLGQQGAEVARGLSSQHRAIELSVDEQFKEARELLTHTAIPTQKRVFGLLQSLYELQTAVYEREQTTTAESNSDTYLTLLIMLGILSLSIGGSTAVVVFRQISQSEKALYQANERFDLAMRGANDGLWDWNIKNNSVYYSPRWKQMLGYAEDEIEDNLHSWE
jgi:PAS domain-containing protein